MVGYVAIARPDHWFKNVFMIIGIVLACFYHAAPLGITDMARCFVAFLATCLMASSNYVLNEILDAPTDRNHPEKCNRPIPSGRVNVWLAYLEWIILAVAGAVLAALLNGAFVAMAVLLWVMGLVYNVRPIRAKELPYADVLVESINNPIRLALGWFVVTAATIPPVTLVVSYWMIGAFLMASKRFAEYRSIADPQRAAAYRASFRHYDENRLLVSMAFYSTAAALFLGMFIIRYHLELILCIPLIAGFFSLYYRLALSDGSAAQAPERLYKERGLMAYSVVCLVVFLALMFIEIPVLYKWFNVEPSSVQALWKIGPGGGP
ncbi:MAG: UbiA prenyltransferase family protein [Pirellulales bacterium]|nr:UbiA prenyltransferase family protein [Pirellulales bacterium]